MRRSNSLLRSRPSAWVVLLMVLVTAWPGLAWGQGPQPQTGPTTAAQPQGLRVWRTEVVVGTPVSVDVGEYASLALDQAGRPHISYYDSSNGDLKYAFWDGETWQIETVDSVGDVGGYTSLALDVNGRPHISYYDQTQTSLKYAHWDGAAWRISTVESVGDVGVHSSLALDAADLPRIAYLDQAYLAVHYAAYNGTGWDVQTVASNVGNTGGYPSLAVGADGHPRISFVDAAHEQMRYARWTGSTWDIQIAATGDYLMTSLALDGNDRPHIAYFDSAGGDVLYTYHDGASWNPEIVESDQYVGFGVSLVLDSFEHPHLSYFNTTSSELRYAYFDGLTWHLASADSAATTGWSGYTSLALDADGHPHVGYFQEFDKDLRYAWFDGSTWQVERVDGVGVGTNRAYPSLALAGDGTLHIAYQDETFQDLRHAWFDGYAWFSEVVADGCAGYVSLAAGAGGALHVSYYGQAGDLRYAVFDGTAWQFELVDDSGNVGQYSSIALDGAGNPAIAYYDVDGGNLKWAHNSGGGWVVETLESAGDVGQHTSLAFDGAGNPHVAYHDVGNANLRYATNSGSGWTFSTVDTGLPGSGDAGHDTSIALDGSGHPHIAYYAAGDGDLKYAHNPGSGWEVETVESLGDVGSHPSLALDSAGLPHVSYYEASSGSLKYAHHNGVSADWEIEMVDSTAGVGPYTSLVRDAVGQNHIAYAGAGELRHAVASPDVGLWSRLTFSSYRDINWEVYIANGNGTNPVRLTSNVAPDDLPELNRGASSIVFASKRPGIFQIYRMNPDGSNQTRLTEIEDEDTTPTWSPDGSQIAFMSFRDRNAEIYRMNADGSNPTRLTAHGAWDGHPTWSPDGSRIAFVSDRTGSYELWVMNADGSNLQQLTAGAIAAAYPDWSPDGSRIAFNDDWNGDGWRDLAIANADGSDWSHPLGASPAGLEYLAPVWAPHGEDLALSRVQWTGTPGEWSTAVLYGLDLNRLSFYPLGNSTADWYPDWQTVDIAAPSSQVLALPAWSQAAFTVRWSGSDSGPAGLRTYDVQVRDGAGGVWTDWQTDTTATQASYTGQGGHTYYFRARARDHAWNLESYPGGDGDAWTSVDVSPPTSSASSPAYSEGADFMVTWSGSDTLSGVAYYDVQVRDGAVGPWTDWQMGAMATAALFNGQPGHVYYFRSRAVDHAGLAEAYPSGDGDTHTYTPAYAVSGTVLGNRDQPILFATVESTPPALNTARSGVGGTFALYYNTSGVFDIEVTHDDFGLLPAMQDLAVGPDSPVVGFILPPADNRVVDGNFEVGSLVAWSPSGELTPTLTSAAHTGGGAVLFGGQAPTPTLGAAGAGVPEAGPWRGVIQQQGIALQPELESGTVSLLYRVEAANPLSDTFSLILTRGAQVTYTLPLDVSGWVHLWWDIPEGSATALGIRLEWRQRSADAGVIVDEISVGSSLRGAYSIYLPVVFRESP